MLVAGAFGPTVAFKVNRYIPLMIGKDRATSKNNKNETKRRKKEDAEIMR